MKGYYKRGNNFDKYWWVTTDLPVANSGYINRAVANQFKKYSELKASVWFWYRSEVVDRKDISNRDKIIAWAICERYRGQSFSTWDSFTYLALMLGMNRKTISKGIQALIEADIIWIGLEGDHKIGIKNLSQARVKKHLLLVGLNKVLYERANSEDK